MRFSTAAISMLMMIAALAACSGNGTGIEIEPFPSSGRMQSCEQYASESFCERQMWGGHP